MAIAAALASPAAAADPPPQAPSRPVTDTFFGVVVADPWRNLEDLKSPETRAWLTAQGDYAADVLAHIDGRQAIAERVAALTRSAGTSIRDVVRMPGQRLYFLRRLAGESQLKLVLRERGGKERVLVDPEAMTKATGTPHAINYFAPSWDGALLAYGVSAGGSEEASLHVLEIGSGKALIAPIPRVYSGPIHWAPDSRSLSYNQVRELPAGTPDTETWLDTTVFLLDPRKSGSPRRPLFGPLVNKELKLERLDVGEVMFAPGGRFMVARTTDTTLPEGRLFVAPVAALAGARPIRWRPISSFDDKITQVEMRGDTLYLRTYAGAPRGRVLALPLADPVLAKAREVVAEPENGVLKGFMLGKSAIYADIAAGFSIRAVRYDEGARKSVDVAPRLAGSTSAIEDRAHGESDLWLTHRSWTEPERVFAAGRSGRVVDTRLLANARPPGAPELEVREVLVRSHDGAMVPLAILHKKGLVLDGSNPTLLDGYGSYGYTQQAYYDPRSSAWLERGGVLAYANVRGGGAFGDAWYKAGFKQTKPNTWKDGVACARWLIEQGYATSKTLGIWGTSAGGIFVGRAVTSAPELFAAAIFDVAVLDAVRAEESANGITNISEFGSVKVEAEFPALLEMSTYHQINPGTPYPAVMLVHGLNDPRVDVWNSAKAAAALQAASSSGKPILLRLDGHAGHGVGSTAEQRSSKQADIYAFLLWQFGRLQLTP